MKIEVPSEFARCTIEREGEEGRRWIEALPGLVDRLCDDWGLDPRGAPLHGYVGLVLPVARGDLPLALKVSWIDASTRQEALVLRHWDGNGAVRLVDSYESAGALLLEWLDPSRDLRSIPADDAVKIAGGLLRRLAVPAPPELATVAAEVEDLVESFRSRWHTAGRPFRESLIDRAVEIGRGESMDSRRVVNRDLHFENVLPGSREPWLVIDPKALAGPIEFGVAQLLWSRFEELGNRGGLGRRIEIVVESADLDRELVVRWSLVRLLDYWLWAIEEGLTEDPARCELLVGWLS